MSSPFNMPSSFANLPSSPPGNNEFPPSANAATGSQSNRTGTGGGGHSLPSAHPVLDPLSFAQPQAFTNGGARGGDGDVDMEADETGSMVGVGRRRVGKGKRLRQELEDIPRVKDTTGERVMERFANFLENFTETISLNAPTPTPANPYPTSDTPNSSYPNGTGQSGQSPERYYIDQIKSLKEYEGTTLYVDMSHLLEREEVLTTAVQGQYYRFLPYLKRAVQALVRKYAPTYLYLSSSRPTASATTHSATHLSSHGTGGLNPALLTREFNVAFYNMPLVNSIRDLRMDKVGRLVAISGTVTRTSEVRPELVSGTFRCEVCRTVIADVEQQFKYTEPSLCPNVMCNNRVSWHLLIEQSKFSDWQKVRIQENASEIPTGSMPRSLDVILRAEMCERAKAGDKCTFVGSFIVVPDVSQLGVPGGVTGLKSLGVRDLLYKTAFLGSFVQQADQKPGGGGQKMDDNGDEPQEAFLNTLTQQEVDELKNMVNADHIYQRLVSSIAPTVYGHEIVKKGILLQLLGGVHKQTNEGINLRGDINVCIVGDPSTSKSQFLKYVCGLVPRAVYTSGKASSAAGLTAAVVKDEESGEFTIEAGALMLADNGICAIDEFDKMDISDQVAIHEAMEQQTISIAKAGIQATLNARTSILAAANPVGGRYNRKMSLRANVAMSAPIMSRFDLFFVVLDECNENVDLHIAQHIVNVHRFRDEAIAPEFSTEALQRYIRYARTFKPKLTTAASHVLVDKYRSLRQDDSGGPGQNSYRITVRQLESMIRLSEAIARANCQDEITPAMVREAYALLKQSIIHVEQDDIDFEDDDEAEEVAPAPADGTNGDGDVNMESQGEASLLNGDSSSGVPVNGTGREGEGEGEGTPTPAQVQAEVGAGGKRKLKITYNKYMDIMNLLILHLSSIERTTSQGLDRDELIEWYLEQKEHELESVEQLEMEREVIGKALGRLVKDRYLMELRGGVGESLGEGEGETMQESGEGEGERRVHYVVHPEVDPSNLSSSAAV